MSNLGDATIIIDNNNDDERGVISISKHNMLLKDKESDFNTYATNKSVSQSVLNFSTFQQQIAFIISLFVGKNTPISGLEITFIVFVGISIVIEIIMFILISLLAKTKTEQCTKKYTATSINNGVTILTFLNAIANFVTLSIFSAIAIDKTNNVNVTQA